MSIQKQIVSLSGWANANQRRLPAFNPGADSKTYQYDGALRLAGNWSYITSRFKSVIRGAYFNDHINYTDSLTSDFSKSRVQTVMAENENYFNWHQNNQLNVGVNVSSSSAFASNLDGRRAMSRVSLLAGNKFSFFGSRLIAYVSARAEYFSVGALPLTGNISAEYALFKNIRAKINAARVYRQPTLNDLYWVPGGNMHLKPEQGYTVEGELNYRKNIGHFILFVSGAAYSRKINNWIQWVPGANGNPSPINIQKVWSRGAETTWRLSYNKNNVRLGLGLVTAYVLSTIEASAQENSSSINTQLIYTPRYSVNGNVSLGYRQLSLFFFHQYTGYRFTTSDNLQWLPPYQISSLKLSYNQAIKKNEPGIFAACNNLFNSNYDILAARPMPLRNFEAGITLQAKQNKNQ